MNGRFASILLSIGLVIGLPRLIFGIWTLSKGVEPQQTHPSVPMDTLPASTIYVLTDKGILEMNLEEYLIGVLLREIPGDFHIEAQKAQAVVARTYTMRTTQLKNKHEQNAICTDSGCCQGYRDPEEYLLSGGSEDRVALAKQAVMETTGQVITYQGLPIDATYFSCSGGQTEDAIAVWGVDIPYLQSVSSPGEEFGAHFTDYKQFTLEAFQQAIGRPLHGYAKEWFGETIYTKGGGVESMRIGGELYTGTQLRELLDLRSTAFAVSVSNDMIYITTKGFGHRVGMSQYGAQAMALRGKEYPEILAHYYPGTMIDKDGFLG